MRALDLLATACLLMVGPDADACSCALYGTLTEQEQIERAFTEADTVIVARVESTKHSLNPNDPTGLHIVEAASFVVLVVLKGAYKVGGRVAIESAIGGGSCGRSARNDPTWLEEVTTDVDPSVVTSAVVSDEWLIYATGAEPFKLSHCDRSFPMNLRGGSDAEYLREWLKEPGRRNGI